MTNPRRNTLKSSPEIPQETKSSSPNIALKELFDLLEVYAPAWYTQEQHDRAEAALSRSTKFHFRPLDAPQETAYGTHSAPGRKQS